MKELERNRKDFLKLAAVFLTSAALPRMPDYCPEDEADLPSLTQFIESVKTGHPKHIAGVYKVILIYGNGRTDSYKIIEISSLTADDPDSFRTTFNDGVTTEKVYRKFYFDEDGGNDKLIFQTCVRNAIGVPIKRIF